MWNYFPLMKLYFGMNSAHINWAISLALKEGL